MSKSIGSIFLTLIFVAFIMAPTIIRLVDDSIDISIIYTTSEEEKGGEKIKNLEVLFFEHKHSLNEEVLSLNNSASHYYFKNYIKPHLNLISPPPETI